MEKKIYCRIDFIRCGLEYDYTICEWHDVKNQIEIAEFAIVDAEENYIQENGTPEIKITPVFMSQDEFNKERESWTDND